MQSFITFAKKTMADLLKTTTAILTTILIGCTHGHPDKDLSFSIFGTIDDANGRTIYLKINLENGYGLLDSAKIKPDGSFAFNALTNRPDFFSLQLEGNENTITIAADTCQKIELHAQAKNFPENYTITGSPESEKICQLENQLTQTKKTSDSLGKIFRAKINNPDLPEIKHSLDSVYHETEKKQRIFSENFLNQNQGSLAALICLSQYIAPRTPIFDPIKDFEIYEKTSTQLSEKYPENIHVKKLQQYVEKLKTLKHDSKPLPGTIKIGFPAPEISLPTIKGDTIKLSDLKGNYVLVDFWASWSNISQKNNELLSKIYWKYNSAGFTVYQIAIDNNRENWKNAIKTQKLPWYNVSDLKLWNCQAAQDYGIKTLPANFLIYPDGIVGQSNLTPQELDETLKNLIGNKIIRKKVEPSQQN